MINKNEEKLKILSLLKKGNGLSRVELNSALKLRPTTLNEIIKELVKINLLHEPDRKTWKTGAKSHKLYINPNYGNLLGLDLGSSCLKVVITNFNGKILYSTQGKYHKERNADELFKDLYFLTDKIRKEKPKLWNKIIGLGIADPGPVNIADGVSLFAFNVKGWEDIETASILSQHFALPTSIHSASQTKAIAEHFFTKDDLESLFMVDMGHGIGAAFIKKNELYSGFSNTEMELGHIMVKRNGRQCACGRRGCLEAEIGSDGILAKFSEEQLIINQAVGDKKITLQDIYSSCMNKDAKSLLVLNEISDLLACALSYVIQLLNPEKIVIHGPIGVLRESFTKSLKQKLVLYCFPEIAEKTSVSCSISDEFQAAVGASLAIREKLLFNQK
jgi:N-acetylglucosamine repressor